MTKDYQLKYLGNIGFQCQAFSCPRHKDTYNTYVFNKDNLSAPIAKEFPLKGCSQNRSQLYGLSQQNLSNDEWQNTPLIGVILPSPDPTGAQGACNMIGVSRDLIVEGIWKNKPDKSPVRVAFFFLTRGYSFTKHYKREIVQNPVPSSVVSNCYPYLEADINFIKPHKLLVCGTEPGRLFFGDQFSIPEYRRRKNLSVRLGSVTYPAQITYNPHLCTTMPPFIKTLWQDCERLFVEQSTYLQRGTFKLITDIKEANTYLDFLETWDDYISVDTETENLNRRATNRLATVQFATDTNVGYVLPIQHKETPFSPDELKHINSRLFSLFHNKARTLGWIAHSAKFENTIFQMHLGTMMDSSHIFDTQSGAYLLDETRSERKGDIPRGGGMYSLKQLARDHLGFDHYDKTTLGFREEGQLFDMPLNDLADYGAMDVYVGLGLHHWNIEEAVRQKYLPQFMKLNKLYYGPATRLIAEIERNGFKVDLPHLRKLNSKFGPLEEKLVRLVNSFQTHPTYLEANRQMVAKSMAGIRTGVTGKVPWVLDVDKPDVKKFIFFDVMKLDPVSFTDKTHLPAVDDDFYKEYAEDHQEVAFMQEYEEAKKMKGTFIDKLLKRVDPKSGDPDSKLDQRVRSNISYSQLVTGRWAMNNPNLGQIPRAEEVKDGEEVDFLVRKAVKDIFTVDRDCALIQVDYKVNEVRWAAILAQDETLAKIFNDAAKLTAEAVMSEDPEKIKIAAILEDIHKNTASIMFNVKPEDVTKKQRQISKNITFGILFQQSARALALAVGIPLEEAEMHIANFFSKFGGVNKLIEDLKLKAQTDGYVEAPHGRRRRFWAFFLPESFSGRMSLINRNLRQCVNAPIQGCQDENDFINTDRGLVRLKELEPSYHGIYTYTGKTNNYLVHDTGVKDVYWFETNKGSARVSKDHRFMSFSTENLDLKLVKTEELTKGSWIVASDLIADNPYIEPQELLYMTELIGVLIGDGTYVSNRDIAIAVDAREVSYIDHLKFLLRSVDAGLLEEDIKLENREGSSSSRLVIHSRNLRSFIATHGLVNEAGNTKIVPDWIFRAGRDIRAAVLRGLYDTDGGISGKIGDGARYTFTSKNENVVLAFQNLAISLGIACSSVKHKDVYRAKIEASCNELFDTSVNPAHTRKKGLTNRKQPYLLPKELVTSVGKFITESELWKEVGIKGNSGRARLNFDKSECGLVYRFLKGSGSAESCIKFLRKLPESLTRDNLIDLCQHKWAQVNKIELLGQRPTKDIEIIHTGNFTEHVYHSHGLLMHNCASDAAMIGGCYSLFEYIRKEKRNWIIQNVVHDSCLVQVPKLEVAEFLLLAEKFFVDGAMDTMRSLGVNFNLPLGCDCEFGIAWGSLVKWDGTKSAAQKAQDLIIKYWEEN